MSLPVTNLDNRTFQSLVDEAKRKIPELCPEWTNHNLSDPGVALIELFAWMTELTLFQLNQVPDAFYTRMLNLIGFEQFPAAAAKANLTFWVGEGGAESVLVPAGTQVTTAGSAEDERVFTTLEDTLITTPDLFAALTSEGDDRFVDVWDELRLGFASVRCFPRQPMTPGDCFYLGFDDSLAGQVIQLSVEANIEGYGVIPDKPPLAWEVWEGEAWVPARIPSSKIPGDARAPDETGGLNRDGRILLLVPPRHSRLTLGGIGAYWLRARLLPPEDGVPAYHASPELRRVSAKTVGGTVVAEHSDVVHSEYIGVSDGKPNQVFTVGRTPVLPRQPHEVLEVIQGDDVEMWMEVGDFVDSDADDNHYVFDSFTGEVRFGPLIRRPDGSYTQFGAVPPDGARLRFTSYRTGGGKAGNVGVGTLSSLRASIPYVKGVTNLEPSEGGVDAESVENAKLRGPQSVRAGGRAVTRSDFERLAKQAHNRIARVRCIVPDQPDDPIQLLVVPKIEEPPENLRLDDFVIPDELLTRIMEYLDDRRILGSKLEISAPYYLGVTVAALLTAQPGRPQQLVRERAMRELYRFVNPLPGRGNPNGWSFDEDLNAAKVAQILDQVEGVQSVDEVLLFQYDLRNHKRIGFGKELIKLPPDTLFLSSNHQVVIK